MIFKMAAPVVESRGGGGHQERFIVGWFDRTEWRNVSEDLFSNDLTQQKLAVGRISVWKSRMLSKLPLAVECTCGIIQAVIEDKSAVINNVTSEKDLSLRMNYSASLVRFVSLLTEKLQTKILAQPMHQLADHLGVPYWMVELRHSASHGTLPSLNMLRSGSQTALNWLKTEYWDVERMAGVEHVTEEGDSNRERLCEIDLVQFMQKRYQMMSWGEDDTRSRGCKKSYDKVAARLLRCSKHNSNIFLKCLLKNGYLIPEDSQLQALSIGVKDYLRHEVLWLPGSLVDMWRHLLCELHSTNIISMLLERLMMEAPGADGARRKLLYSWAALIIESVNMPQSGSGVHGLLCFPTMPLIDYLPLLKTCLTYPNNYTTILLPRLLWCVRPPLSRRQRNDITDLTDIMLSTGAPTKQRHKFEANCVNDVVELRERMEQLIQTDDSDSDDTSTSNWRIADSDIRWADYPFGACPSGVVNCWNLQLSVDQQEIDQITVTKPLTHRSTTDADDRNVSHEVKDSEGSDESCDQNWSQDVFNNILSAVNPM